MAQSCIAATISSSTAAPLRKYQLARGSAGSSRRTRRGRRPELAPDVVPPVQRELDGQRTPRSRADQLSVRPAAASMSFNSRWRSRTTEIVSATVRGGRGARPGTSGPARARPGHEARVLAPRRAQSACPRRSTSGRRRGAIRPWTGRPHRDGDAPTRATPRAQGRRGPGARAGASTSLHRSLATPRSRAGHRRRPRRRSSRTGRRRPGSEDQPAGPSPWWWSCRFQPRRPWWSAWRHRRARWCSWSWRRRRRVRW
jgi:hypothetical protein